MKSEHRHELQTNDLSKVLDRTKPFLEAYGASILMALVGGIVLAIGYYVWSNSTHSRREAGWAELAAAQSAEDFDTVVEDFPGTKVAFWAKLRSAESHLQSGIPQAFSNRAGALDSLEQAKTRFQELADAPGAPPEVRERALFGLGRTLETLSDGNAQPAIDAYQKLVDDFPESVYRTEAEARVTDLKTGSAQEFYAWFHKQNPTPADRTRPSDIHGGIPGMNDLPVRLPEIPEKLKSSGATTEPAATPGDQPTTPPSEEPAQPESKPTAEKEPTEKKPATEKPASEKSAEKSESPQPETTTPKSADKSE